MAQRTSLHTAVSNEHPTPNSFSINSECVRKRRVYRNRLAGRYTSKHAQPVDELQLDNGLTRQIDGEQKKTQSILCAPDVNALEENPPTHDGMTQFKVVE